MGCSRHRLIVDDDEDLVTRDGERASPRPLALRYVRKLPCGSIREPDYDYAQPLRTVAGLDEPGTHRVAAADQEGARVEAVPSEVRAKDSALEHRRVSGERRSHHGHVRKHTARLWAIGCLEPDEILTVGPEVADTFGSFAGVRSPAPPTRPRFRERSCSTKSSGSECPARPREVLVRRR